MFPKALRLKAELLFKVFDLAVKVVGKCSRNEPFPFLLRHKSAPELCSFSQLFQSREVVSLLTQTPKQTQKTKNTHTSTTATQTLDYVDNATKPAPTVTVFTHSL